MNQDGINKAFGSRGVVSRAPAGRRRPGHALERHRHGQGGRYPDRYNMQGARLLHHRRAQHQGRRAVQLGPVRRTRVKPTATCEQRLHERRAQHGHHLQHAAALQGRPARRRRHLRPGLVDDQPPDAERRAALGIPQLGGVGAGVGAPGRFVGERTFAAIPMPIWKDFAPRFGVGLRPVRQCQDRAQVRPQPLQRVAHDAASPSLQPAGADHGVLRWTDLNSDDIAQGELGCVYLDAGLRDQLRADAGEVRHAVRSTPSIRTSSACTTSRRAPASSTS